jgi:hypothetical protein
MVSLGNSACIHNGLVPCQKLLDMATAVCGASAGVQCSLLSEEHKLSAVHTGKSLLYSTWETLFSLCLIGAVALGSTTML